MTIVRLTAQHWRTAAEIARQRQASHDDAGRHDGVVTGRGIERHIEGCVGELAFALWSGLAWDGALFDLSEWQRWRMQGHDVSGFEVRATKHPSGRLIVHPSDKDGAVFVLARILSSDAAVRGGEVELVGWLFAAEVKRWGSWEDVGHSRPCFYAPTRRLRPMRLGLCMTCGERRLGTKDCHWDWNNSAGTPSLCGRMDPKFEDDD